MNVIWSKYIQGAKTLYLSRKLRFADEYSQTYKSLFNLDSKRKIKILEIGCGPGALSEALLRWYPKADITAIDRDSEFIRFAKDKVKGVTFLEGDATVLPFSDESFDVTISNTVAEHVEVSKFYSEQKRVLKKGGICIVLSSRKGISVKAECLKYNEFEKAFWEKAASLDDTFEKYQIGKFSQNEAELPLNMEKNGFTNVKTGYLSLDFTPDSPHCSALKAEEIINYARESELESVESVLCSLPNHFTESEAEDIISAINKKYDKRLSIYESNTKLWDTEVSLIMLIRGVKM